MIDLFAGIGGIRLGFERAFGDDARTVFVSEIDKYARATYEANFPNSPPIAGDITQIDADTVPAFDICLAGFPCQAFSIAGRRAGFDDDYYGTCRGTLFLDVVRICDRHKPKVIFCENVKGLVGHDGGRTFKVICAAFEQIGYKIFHAVLNSKDFGLAQNRERIYIVCFRKDIAPDRFDFPAPTDERSTIRDILEYAPIPAKYYLSDVYLATLREHRRRHEAAGNGFGYEIKDLDGVASALVCGGMGRERNLITDEREHSLTPTTKIKGAINLENVRKLTPREWARLQGFDDDFELTLSDTCHYKQFGNTVSINVVAAIAQEIRSVLDPMTGNKGEWSEFYTLLKILADGGINAEVNGEQNRLPVLKVFREDVADVHLEFRRGKKFVDRYQNGKRIRRFKASEFATMAEKVLDGIKRGKGAFAIDGAEEFIGTLGLTRLRSPADKKADIELEVHDRFTNSAAKRFYSIKSKLGSAPTLFNSSGATNFRFNLPDVDDALANKLNGEHLSPKEIAREVGRLEFVSVVDKTFAVNLRKIETHMDKILGEAVKLYYRDSICGCTKLAKKLGELDPLQNGDADFYFINIKKFLCAVALGLKPATLWNGEYEANGGYIVVQKNGELAAYPLRDLDEFKTYLLNNTRLDTPKVSRHNFATIYTGGGGI